jgi:Endonuclease NucS
MAIYLCAVATDAPENYEIGLKSRTWGVTSQYRKRIEGVMKGDTLVFLVGGRFRSIHRVESDPFEDRRLLWPPLENGDPYPFRISLSQPQFQGDVRARDLAQHISMFQKFPSNWGLAVQGPKGIFNPGLSQADLELIKAQMAPIAPGALPPPPDPALVRQATDRQQAFFRFYEKDVEDHFDPILGQLGLTLYRAADGRLGRQFAIEGGRIDLLCRDPKDEAYVVLELKKGEAPQDTLLQTLRYMSYVRTYLAQGKGVRGIILTEAADKTLVNVVQEVPNIQIRYYRVSIELV